MRSIFRHPELVAPNEVKGVKGPIQNFKIEMTASQIIFYILSAFILVTAILSVTTRKIFRSAIWLLFSLIGIAGLYFGWKWNLSLLFR